MGSAETKGESVTAGLPRSMLTKRKARVRAPMGMHMRPWASLARTALAFKCTIKVGAGSQSADGKSIISLMLLRAPQGTVLSIETDGEDAEACMNALANLADLELGQDGRPDA